MAPVSRAVGLGIAALLALASPAAAGPPGSWTQVTQPSGGGSSTDKIDVARSGNGVLNVLWFQNRAVVNSQVSADGKTVTGPHPVYVFQQGPGGAPALLAAPGGGLRAFFAGLDTGTGPHDGVVSTATSADGISWAVQPTGASDSTPSGSNSIGTLGGTIWKNGTPMSIWSDQYRGYHIGVSDQTPNVGFGPSRTASVFGPDAATDSATGQVAIGWNDERTAVAFVQPTTNPWFPPGPTMYAPEGRAPDLAFQIGMSGRSGTNGGIFVAYLRGTNVFSGRPAVWRIGAANPIPLTSKRGGRYPGVTAGPNGRLWAFWGQEHPTTRTWQIFVRRSNTDATGFGGPVTLNAPAGTESLWGLEGVGEPASGCDALDILAQVTRSGTTANYHQRLLPGITLKKKVLNKRKGRKAKVRFKTFDAGVPLDTKIKFGSKRAATGDDGKVNVKIKRKRRTRKVKATATRPCYSKAQVRVKVKKQRRRRR